MKIREAIILASGWGKRLKPQIKTPKPLVNLNSVSLLTYQVKWLKKNGFSRIIIPSQTYDLTTEKVVWIHEKTRLGTGGAVRLALSEIQGKKVYVMNCDDIVFYDPKRLWRQAHLGASILVTKLRSPYGIIEFDRAGNVQRFREKPKLPFWISTGHYVFMKDIIEDYFPKKGDLELSTMQKLADQRKLIALEYDGKWLTLNTYKQVLEAREYFKREKNKLQAI